MAWPIKRVRYYATKKHYLGHKQNEEVVLLDVVVAEGLGIVLQLLAISDELLGLCGRLQLSGNLLLKFLDLGITTRLEGRKRGSQSNCGGQVDALSSALRSQLTYGHGLGYFEGQLLPFDGLQCDFHFLSING